MKHREKIRVVRRRADDGRAAGNAAGDRAPAARAELEDMRNKFEDGVEKYRSNGKDLYKLPRYLLVGPPASGKTETTRHVH